MQRRRRLVWHGSGSRRNEAAALALALADQLKRAAQSVVLNIAEARGNDAGNARTRFSTACGSAKEVRAALNVASDWGYIETHMATHLDRKLDEVCAITWCLGRRL